MQQSPIRIVFFGSTSDSVIVLSGISQLSTAGVSIVAVVTQPPKPVGRRKIITPTPVENWANTHNTTVLSFPNNPDKPWLFADEQAVINTLESVRADLVISASYGQKIPTKTLTDARFGGLNVHPSILPRWRGGDPVPWAIMSGAHQTGVTVVSLSEHFDEGRIFAQKKIPITDTDTSKPLRTKLFTTGAKLLAGLLPDYVSGKANGKIQKFHDEPYAKRLSRDTGCIPWELVRHAIEGHCFEQETIQRYSHIAMVHILSQRQNTLIQNMPIATAIDQAFRALHPWPGVWTHIQTSRKSKVESEMKRLKILACHLTHDACLAIDTVQLEGKTPVSWEQFTEAYTPSSS